MMLSVILLAAPLITAQTCNANFVTAASNGGTCPASRSCLTTSGCCGSCSSNNGNCFAYTCGSICQNTPCSACPAGFDPLPSDDTGSRVRGSCPATRPHMTTTGCCGACATDSGTVMAYHCGSTCSNSPDPGCSSTAPGTTSSPPPPPTSVQSLSPPPPPPSSSNSLCQAPVGSFCCDDDPANPNYVCQAGTLCGRGVCVPAGNTLCGCSGQHFCPAGTTCCGTSCCSTTSFCGGDPDSCSCSSNAFPSPRDELQCGSAALSNCGGTVGGGGSGGGGTVGGGESNIAMPAAAAGGAVVVLLGIGFWCYQTKARDAPPKFNTGSGTLSA